MYPFAKCSTKLYSLLLVYFAYSGLIRALQSDYHCLKSIKDSLEDPLGYLANWDFANKTEGSICRFTGVECWHPDESKVLNIRIADMELKGQFPRGLEYCSSLTGLDLSANHINGSIPSNISRILNRVTTLDLSSNKFSGEIPPDMANCTYLNVIDLENNQLTGQIPREFGSLPRLKTFHVANNFLTGPVPQFRYNISADSYAGNQGLCGAPLDLCKIPPPPKDNSGRDIFISGFTTGWALFMLLTLYLRLFGLPCATISNMFSGNNAKVNIPSACPEQEDIANNAMIMKLEKYVSRMSFTEMESATDNFSHENVVGYGSIGKVYKALFPNGWLLAIKRLHDTENLDEEFASEIMILGMLRHQNLVPMIGFCSQGKEKLLVYKYMSNGNLHEWLHSTENKAKALTWPLRMRIAVGVAKALSWLHYNCHVNVVHNGLCSKCILLDHDFEPKVSKFWEANILNSHGLTCSWSPSDKVECGDNFSPYTKDVYCFGIVLLELITRKEAYELSCSTEVIFGSYTTNPLQVDGELTHTGFDDVISQFLEIAKSCVKFLPNQRPTMLQVYESVSSLAQACMINNTSFEISSDYA